MAGKRVLILGGGLGGFYVARGLEKSLRPGEADVTLVDMRSGLVYQPFLAEVASGAIEARHVQVPFSRHLRRTRVVQAKVEEVSLAERVVRARLLGPVGADPGAARPRSSAARAGTASPAPAPGRPDAAAGLGDCGSPSLALPFDHLVVALGAVTRTLPIPGIAEQAVGLKSPEEACYLRDSLMRNVRAAAELPPGSPERARLLTLVCVGGGFSGMEGFAELFCLARELCRADPRLDPSELRFHLVEAADRVFPELTQSQSGKAVARLERLGAHVHLKTFVTSAEGGQVRTSDGACYDAPVILWTAGVAANPVLRASDLPLEPRGRVTCGADLRVVRDGEPVPGAWALGDCAQVPDLTGHGLPDGSCSPTAQHSMRQSKALVENLAACLRAEGASAQTGGAAEAPGAGQAGGATGQEADSSPSAAGAADAPGAAGSAPGAPGASGAQGAAGAPNAPSAPAAASAPTPLPALREYRHENAGMVAGLGMHYGAFTSGALTKGGAKVRFNGWLAWMAHRAYHSLAVPAAERRFRIWSDWVHALFFGRDTAELGETSRPRAFFEEFAARPEGRPASASPEG